MKSRPWRKTSSIFFISLDTLFWSKKTILIGLLALAVIALAGLGRLVMSLRWVRTPFTAEQAFGVLTSLGVVQFLVILVTLFYGTALIADEIEGKTLTYLFIRPIPKPLIMLGKYLALIWIAMLMTLPPVLASYALLYAAGDMERFFADLSLLGKDLGVISLAVFSYGSLFSFIGVLSRHSTLVGLIYGFGWEGIVSYLPGLTRRLTISHYVQSLLPHEVTAGTIGNLLGEPAAPWEAIVTLTLVAVFFLAAAGLLLREREFVLEQ